MSMTGWHNSGDRRRSATIASLVISIAVTSNCALIDLDPALVESQLKWQPFTRYNYTSPGGGKYCSHPQCLRCSDPAEWETQPYRVCEVMPRMANGSQEELVVEFASPPYTFQGLLLCFAAQGLNLSRADSVRVDLLREGGLLYDNSGEAVHPPNADNPTRIFLEGEEGETEDTSFRAVEVGRMRDFLAYDPYYARTFEYARYDNFLSWEDTRPLASALLNRHDNNCVLLSSSQWKRTTRYELALTLFTNTQGRAAAGGVWAAAMAYETETVPAAGRTEDDDLKVDFPGIVSQSDAGFLGLSVRGHKGGAVCSVAPDPLPPTTQCPAGYVSSRRNRQCIFCPRLNDAARHDDCSPEEPLRSWDAWTNHGERDAEQDCCPSNTFPQLIGREACGAAISPSAVDSDLSHLDYHTPDALPARLCHRYGRIREIFVRSYCDLKCAQSGNVLSELCVCQVEFQKNATWVTDVYMARVVVRDFMYEGRALWDTHALDKARGMVRAQNLDRDLRRPTNPTRQRGLQGIWSRSSQDRPGEFNDYYNRYIDFQQDPELSLQDQKGSVADSDTLYLSEVNIRLMGLLLAHPSLSPAPLRCSALYDPFAEGADEGLLHGARDPYWPLYGHPPDEI